MHHKTNLPTKTCIQCGRPFTWRRKWARDWEQVKYCSDACRRGKVPDRTGGAAVTPARPGRG